MAKGPARLRRRGPVPDDGDRDRVQSTFLGEPGGHRPRRAHLHQGHAAGSARAQPRLRAVLHHRRRRAGLHSVVARLGRAVRVGAVHRRQPTRLRAAARTHHRRSRRADRGCVDPRRDPGAGDLVDRLPSTRRAAPAAVVSDARRRRAIRQKAPALPHRAAKGSRPAQWRPAWPPGTTRERHPGSDRYGDGGRQRGRRQAGRRCGRHRRLRAAGDHGLLRHRLGVQRASGQRHRRRGRGENAQGGLPAGAPRGRPGRPLDAVGLPRHRRAHPASGRPQLLRPGPAVA